MVLEQIRTDNRVQIVLGLLTGIVFGFLLQKGGVTDYGVIIGQLLLTDFTVLKVMLSAVLIGMIGIYAMKSAGLVRLHCRVGSVGATVIGGLIFGAGFAILGYCPGTAAGAVGSGRWMLPSEWSVSLLVPGSSPGSTRVSTARSSITGPFRQKQFRNW